MDGFINESMTYNVNRSLETSTYAEEHMDTYIVLVAFAIIFIVGVVGNGTLILIFLRHSQMRNVPNIYIFSLALGDLLVIITTVPFTSLAYALDNWPFGELLCKVSEFGKDVSVGVSVFTLTALSGDRFFAIVDPMRTLTSGGNGRRATRMTILTALSIWLFSVVCATPSFVFSYIRNFPNDTHPMVQACYPFPEEFGTLYPKVTVITRFFVYYAIPLIIIGLFYVLMARHLIHSTLNMPGEVHGQARQIRARRKVAKTVLAFVIIFAICFLPQQIFSIWFHTNPNMNEDFNEFWYIFRTVGFILSYMNSCINPIALYCVSGAFRKHFNQYLLCCMRGQGCNCNEQGRGGGMDLTNSKRVASRRCNSRSTWDSTTLGPFQNHSMVRRNPNAQVLLQQQEDITLTTSMNGRGNGLTASKRVPPQLISFN